uniref:Amiloride-sensitive sodium channel n=1 Tax=Panagrellus redivivus TaxID=6233 RepID=A0A7E4ZXS8_PANRE
MDSLYLPSSVNAVDIAKALSELNETENNNDNEKCIQCDLLTEDEGHAIDPTRLSYKDRITWHLKEFCYKTSSHGIPMLGQAPNNFYRLVWVCLLTACGCMFIYQAVNVVEKYQRMDKITDIQLKFDTAPFPAITMCNLNPYKDSLLKDVEAVRKILSVYSNVMDRAGKFNSKEDEIRRVATLETRKALQTSDVMTTMSPASPRIRRESSKSTSFEPAYADCTCSGRITSMECDTDVNSIPKSEEETCLCAFDRDSGDAWPCYPKDKWEEHTCKFCDEHNVCTIDEKAGIPPAATLCLCQTINPFCVAFNKESAILKLWEYYVSGIHDPKVVEALGFAKGCFRDFEILVDPTFGNCFTFNHNRTQTLSSIRAGPMYGLRMLIFVNVSEYLPTTEAVGVRITIHDKEDYPFPDTFGYSAPTGFISSFGMRMTRMSRLPAPYGDCIPDGLTTNYIYKGYRYSTEGCYRTCFQELVLNDCGCGDPRFPVLTNKSHCQVFDPAARKCLEQRTNDLSNVHGSFRCRCQQPCDQSVYTVSYSEANWPSTSLNISLGNCDKGPDLCNEHYMENGAMIEVFYEALNFEVFTESEAYGIVKMLADFGGQLGLWSGVSFITMCEFTFLALEIIYMVFNHHYNIYKRKKQAEAEENGL